MIVIHREHAEHLTTQLAEHLGNVRDRAFHLRDEARLAREVLERAVEQEVWASLGYADINEWIAGEFRDIAPEMREQLKLIETDIHLSALEEVFGYLPGMMPPVPKSHAKALSKLDPDEKRSVYRTVAESGKLNAKTVRQEASEVLFQKLPPEAQKRIIETRKAREEAREEVREQTPKADRRASTLQRIYKSLDTLRKDAEREEMLSALEALQDATLAVRRYESLFATGQVDNLG